MANGVADAHHAVGTTAKRTRDETLFVGINATEVRALRVKSGWRWRTVIDGIARLGAHPGLPMRTE